MFFQAAQKGANEWWMFLIGIVAVSLGYLIGQIPLFIAIAMAAAHLEDPRALEEFASSMDFNAMGIDPNLGLLLALLMFVVATLALYIVIKYLHGRNFTSLINNLGRIRWSRFFFGFGLWLTLGVVYEIYNYVLNPDSYSFQFSMNGFLPLFVISVLFIPIQASFEELFIRGYLMQGIGLLLKTRVADIVLTSSVFGILHLIIPQVRKFDSAILVFYYAGVAVFLTLILSNSRAAAKRAVAILITSLIFAGLHLMFPEISKFSTFIKGFYYSAAAGMVVLILPNSRTAAILITSLIFAGLHLMFPEISKFETFTIVFYYSAVAGILVLILPNSKVAAILLTSFIFAGLHLMNPEISKFGTSTMVIYYTVVAIFLAVITVIDDGLELAMGVHTATNLFGSLIVTFEGSALQTEALFILDNPNAWVMLVATIFSAIIFFLVARRKYHWIDWRKIYGPVYRPMEKDPSITEL